MALIIKNIDLGFGFPLQNVYAKISNITYEFISQQFSLRVDYYVNKESRDVEKEKQSAVKKIQSVFQNVDVQYKINEISCLYEDRKAFVANIKRDDLSDGEKESLEKRLLKLDEKISELEGEFKNLGESKKGTKKLFESASKNISLVNTMIYGATEIQLTTDREKLIKSCYKYLKTLPDFKKVENDL